MLSDVSQTFALFSHSNRFSGTGLEQIHTVIKTGNKNDNPFILRIVQRFDKSCLPLNENENKSHFQDAIIISRNNFTPDSIIHLV